MARLRPKVNPKDISNTGERLVATALVDQLPDDCLVYHSYPWLRQDRALYSGRVKLRQGEVDFIIVHPKAGMLILEVKGGEIEYDHTQHMWVRVMGKRTEQITDPFEQASNSMHYLVKKIAGNKKNFPCPTGFAVVFPQSDYTGEPPPGSDPQVILGSKDMDRLDARIKNALEKWHRTWHPPIGKVSLSEDQMQAIQLGISPVFNLTPILFRKIDEQEERLHRLTEGQLQLLDYLEEHNRAAIKGVAGSGKTILANTRAQKFASEGKKILFVCYNTALAESLEFNAPDSLKDQITYTSFHKLCRTWCIKAGLGFKPPAGDSSEFWEADAPNLLIEAIDLIEDRYDAVVVDEGQDFRPTWWIALEMINKEEDEGPFYVFYDPHQNLYDTQMSLPELGNPFNLPVNCRNTREIAGYCGEVNGTDIKVREETPQGDKVLIKNISGGMDRKKFVVSTVKDWLSKGHLNPSRIAILSFYDRAKTCMSKESDISGVPIVIDQEKWRSGKGILFNTIRAFKGLEADAIILVDIPDFEVETFFTKADLYVGCSRAKHILVIAAKENFSL